MYEIPDTQIPGIQYQSTKIHVAGLQRSKRPEAASYEGPYRQLTSYYRMEGAPAMSHIEAEHTHFLPERLATE